MKKAINVLCAVFCRANVALTVARVTTKLKVVRQSFNNKKFQQILPTGGLENFHKIKRIAKVSNFFCLMPETGQLFILCI